MNSTYDHDRYDPDGAAKNELIAEMYQSVTHEEDELVSAIPKIHGKSLITDITSQLERYADLEERTKQLMTKKSVAQKKQSLAEKLKSKGGMMVNTMFDSSDGHIADMIVNSAKTSADRLEAKLNAWNGGAGDAETAGLCREIIECERREAVKMREYAQHWQNL